MANNECTLSQASGYTSNSNSTNNFDLNVIEGIELNRVTYGADLSERLEDINENFNKIIESDFLRGAPGRSVSISTWVFNNETKDTPMGQSLIDAIMSNNPSTAPSTTTTTTTITPEIDPLISVIVEALMGKEIKVICDESGNIVSSLPFTFIDPRFSSINMQEYNGELANETDLSCVLVYETTTDSSGFNAPQTFPTLYWDTNIGGGNFCWKINGQKTGLPCKGPQGNDGSGGTLYTVLYNPAEIPASNGTVACEIVGVMGLNGTNVSDIKNEFIPKNQFKDRQIAIKTGDTVIAIPGSIDGSGNVLFTPYSNSSIGTTVASDVATYMYSITTAFVTNDDDDNYYVVISGDTIHIPYVLQGGSLANLMNMIGGDYMLGLYIPTEKSNGSITKGHTLWSDRVNSSNLCIGEVTNPAEINKWSENPELVDSPSSVSLLYDEVSVGKDSDHTKAITKIINHPTTDIVKMYPKSLQYQTIKVDRFKNSYWIDNMFETTHGVIGGTYDFCSVSSREGYFGIYQRVKIGEVWRYAARITSETGKIFYILWKDLDDFISLLDKWYACINQENEGDVSLEHVVDIVELNNLRVEDNDWVCESSTPANSSSIHWSNVYQFKNEHSIKRVNCDKVCILGRNTVGFIYTVKDNDGATYEFISRTLTVNKNENDKCILPIQPYGTNDAGYCVPLVITGFAGASLRIEVENVHTLSGGVNSFDVHATQNLYHQYYVPYSRGAKLLEKYHQYEGVFDQYYKVNANDIRLTGKNKFEIEATDINIEATESHIKSTQHRVGHTRYIKDGNLTNLVSFQGVVIHPNIFMPEMFDDLKQNIEYDLYIPLCELNINKKLGYASVYKIKPNAGTTLSTHLILWSANKEKIINFYKTYYKIISTSTTPEVPELTTSDFARMGILLYQGHLEEPYDKFANLITDPFSPTEPFILYNTFPKITDQKTFVREEVSIYTNRIEWIERDPHTYPQRRFTINLSPDEIVSKMSDGNGGFIIAKYTGETKSQDPSKYAIIMYGNIRQAQPSYENLGETYLYDSKFTDFKNIYKYDADGHDSFNKVLIIDRADTTLPATNSSCETWQEKVYTRGLEIKNDCSEYSVYCNQFFVNGIDIVPLLPKLQELVSSSNS